MLNFRLYGGVDSDHVPPPDSLFSMPAVVPPTRSFAERSHTRQPARATWVGFLLYSPELVLTGMRAEIRNVPADSLSKLPAGLGRVRLRAAGTKGRAVFKIDLDGSLVRMLRGPDGQAVRGVPAAMVLGDKLLARSLVKGAFNASPLCSSARGWKVACPSAERALALVGLLRRCGVSARLSSSDHAPIVRIAMTERSALEGLDIDLPAVVEQSRPAAAAGQETLDAINAQRRAEQEGRTRRALEMLGNMCPPTLRRAGELRVAFPDLSLGALGEMMAPPATRHAVCGQLRRLHQMATELEARRKQAADFATATCCR